MVQPKHGFRTVSTDPQRLTVYYVHFSAKTAMAKDTNGHSIMARSAMAILWPFVRRAAHAVVCVKLYFVSSL